MNKPNFIIVGECRCGSSALFEYLMQNPDIKPPNKFDNFKYNNSEYFLTQKEPRFFDKNWNFGLKWYYSLFPDNAISGDCSATYLYNDEAMNRIKTYIPDVKIIILLRNPVQKAISHFYHLKNIDKIKLNLESFIEEYGFSHEIFQRGIYITSLQKHVHNFKNIIIIKSEDLFNNKIENICKFLEITKHSKKFVQYRESNKDDLNKALIDKIDKFYEPYNNELLKYFSINW